MKKKIIWGVIVVVIIAVGAYAYMYFSTPAYNYDRNHDWALDAETADKVLPGGVVYDFKGDALINSSGDYQFDIDWKRYTNSEYGFSLRYPTDWAITSDSYAQEGGYYNIYLDRVNRKTNSVGAPILGLRIYAGVKDMKSFGAFNSINGSRSVTNINGIVAEEILFVGQNGEPAISVGFVKNGEGYVLSSFDSEGDKTIALARTILLTLEFTN